MEGIQKKIAVLNDLSGYGRCSLTAAMPVISALKVQCCPVVTAVLSNHAGYPECYMDDYTDRMEAYLEPWRKMGFEMDGIMTGFLGSARQVSIVADFIRDFKRENTQVLVDPTMGDHGHLYSVCDEDLIEAMRELMQYADVVTPNLTEACALTDTLYQENGWSKRKLSDLTWKLHLLGARKVLGRASLMHLPRTGQPKDGRTAWRNFQRSTARRSKRPAGWRIQAAMQLDLSLLFIRWWRRGSSRRIIR